MKYDLIVIGGGPAGIIAAGRAGELGSRVLLLEKNKELGKKLLMTGKGRCNITNKKENIREFIKEIGPNGKFLFSALSFFGINETIEFFRKIGIRTKIEEDNRVFPVSDKSRDVLKALIDYLKESKVEIRMGAEVKRVVKRDNVIEKVILMNGEELQAKKFIIATGGKSYFRTGSTGDGYRWARELGHTINEPTPSLSPMIMNSKVIKKLEGLSLRDIKLSLYGGDNKKIESVMGDVVFTSDGVSGPSIINMSRKITKIPVAGFKLKIDLFPDKDFRETEQMIQDHFQEISRKIFSNSLEEFLSPKLIPVIVKLSGIDPEKKVLSITREERKKIIHLLKDLTFELKSLAGFDKAIVTSGGIDLGEIDQKTMKSKFINNLYFAGEVIDLDGPTGGYNLQISWTTGYLAGEMSRVL